MFSREELEKLNIHELRSRARMLGVKAPTTKKQSQLIDEIVLIENGELEAFKSKMGRPPKNRIINVEEFNPLILDKSLANLGYGQVFRHVGFNLADTFECQNLAQQSHPCLGIVRILDDKTYIKNYSGGIEFAILKDAGDLKLGDLIDGKAIAISQHFSSVQSYIRYDFDDADVRAGSSIIKTCEDVADMYDFIKSEKDKDKIIVEVEANIYTSYDFSQEQKLFLHTNECDDIVDSYNLLLDIRNLVVNLSKENKVFSLYLIDVEYIYSILCTYYSMKGVSADVNAGQFFKEILSSVNNSKGGKITLFEKHNGKRSSYLDIILNKYCKHQAK